MKKLFFLTLLSVGMLKIASAQTVRLIMVADVVDIEFGMVNMADQATIEEMFRLVSKNLNYEFKPTYLEKDNFKASAIKNYFDTLTAKPLDLLVFYYSGRRYYNSQDSLQDNYPFLNLNDWKTNPLSLREVAQIIQSKKETFGFVMAECKSILSNSVANTQNFPTSVQPVPSYSIPVNLSQKEPIDSLRSLTPIPNKTVSVPAGRSVRRSSIERRKHNVLFPLQPMDNTFDKVITQKLFLQNCGDILLSSNEAYRPTDTDRYGTSFYTRELVNKYRSLLNTADPMEVDKLEIKNLLELYYSGHQTTHYEILECDSLDKNGVAEVPSFKHFLTPNMVSIQLENLRVANSDTIRQSIINQLKNGFDENASVEVTSFKQNKRRPSIKSYEAATFWQKLENHNPKLLNIEVISDGINRTSDLTKITKIQVQELTE